MNTFAQLIFIAVFVCAETMDQIEESSRVDLVNFNGTVGEASVLIALSSNETSLEDTTNFINITDCTESNKTAYSDEIYNNLNSSSTTANCTKACFASIMKNESLIDLSFPSEPYNGSPHFCKNSIIKPLAVSFDLENSNDLRTTTYDVSDCVLTMFKKYNLLNLYLKGFTFYLYDEAPVSDFKAEHDDVRKLFLNMTLDFCDHKRFGRKFDEMSNATLPLGPDELCTRKYLLEHGFMQPHEWILSLPLFDPTDCEYIFKDLEDSVDMLRIYEQTTFFGLRVPNASFCIYQKFKSMKLNENRKTIEVKRRVSYLNAQNLRKLRNEFIELESKAAEDTIECLALAMTIANVQ